MLNFRTREITAFRAKMQKQEKLNKTKTSSKKKGEVTDQVIKYLHMTDDKCDKMKF